MIYHTQGEHIYHNNEAGFTGLRLKPMIYHTQGQHIYHNNEAVMWRPSTSHPIFVLTTQYLVDMQQIPILKYLICPDCWLNL